MVGQPPTRTDFPDQWDDGMEWPTGHTVWLLQQLTCLQTSI